MSAHWACNRGGQVAPHYRAFCLARLFDVMDLVNLLSESESKKAA